MPKVQPLLFKCKDLTVEKIRARPLDEEIRRVTEEMAITEDSLEGSDYGNRRESCETVEDSLAKTGFQHNGGLDSCTLDIAHPIASPEVLNTSSQQLCFSAPIWNARVYCTANPVLRKSFMSETCQRRFQTYFLRETAQLLRDNYRYIGDFEQDVF